MNKLFEFPKATAKRVKEYTNAATPGPWLEVFVNTESELMIRTSKSKVVTATESDIKLMAESREDVAILLQIIENLEAENDCLMKIAFSPLGEAKE